MPSNEDLLATIVSNAIFWATGFGPSGSICLPFARQVLDEADAVNHPITFEEV